MGYVPNGFKTNTYYKTKGISNCWYRYIPNFTTAATVSSSIQLNGICKFSKDFKEYPNGAGTKYFNYYRLIEYYPISNEYNITLDLNNNSLYINANDFYNSNPYEYLDSINYIGKDEKIYYTIKSNAIVKIYKKESIFHYNYVGELNINRIYLINSSTFYNGIDDQYLKIEKEYASDSLIANNTGLYINIKDLSNLNEQDESIISKSKAKLTEKASDYRYFTLLSDTPIYSSIQKEVKINNSFINNNSINDYKGINKCATLKTGSIIGVKIVNDDNGKMIPGVFQIFKYYTSKVDIHNTSLLPTNMYKDKYIFLYNNTYFEEISEPSVVLSNNEELMSIIDENERMEAINTNDQLPINYTTSQQLTSINTDLNVKDVEDQSTSYMELFQNTTYTNKVQEAIKNVNTTNINSIYGAPTQFLPLTDPRINIVPGNSEDSIDVNNITGVGRIYGEKILTQMPFLYIIPGVPEFMAGFAEEQRKSILASMIDGIEDNAQIEDLVNNSGGRYYNIRFARAEYVNYLNAMLHAAVALLQIDKETINGTELAVYDWSTPLNKYAVSITNNPNGNFFSNIAEASVQFVQQITSGIISGVSSVINGTLDSFKYLFTGEMTEAMKSNIDTINENGDQSSLIFFADCGNQTDDSFSNSTTQSQLLSQLNSLSDLGREISYVTGIVDANGTMVLNKLLDGGLYTLDKATDFANTAIGKGNLISNIISKARTILSGGRMLFPEIWADSSFSRSYSFRMKLISPSGDKLSVFLNILVPIYHLLALVLPRQSKGTPEGYYSPFLVKAACKSLLNIDMGIITDLNLTKGGEAEWTVDGLPTVAEISFTIKDLYEGLSMTELGGPIDGILSNASEIDYIANSCGVNIYEHYLRKNVELFKILYLSQFSSIDNLQNSIIAGINNAGVRLTDFVNNRSRAIMRMLTPRNL